MDLIVFNYSSLLWVVYNCWFNLVAFIGDIPPLRALFFILICSSAYLWCITLVARTGLSFLWPEHGFIGYNLRLTPVTRSALSIYCLNMVVVVIFGDPYLGLHFPIIVFDFPSSAYIRSLTTLPRTALFFYSL